jgi:hypothetical protein
LIGALLGSLLGRLALHKGLAVGGSLLSVLGREATIVNRDIDGGAHG